MNIIKTQESVSFIAAANTWRQNLRQSKLSQSTIKTYESIIDSQLMPRLSNYKLSEISQADLDDFYCKTSLTPDYIRVIKRVMAAILKYSQNNSAAIPAQAQAKLETAINENDACVFMSVLMRENISMSKLLALGIDDVDEKTCSVILRRKMSFCGNSFKTVPVNEVQTVKITRESLKLLTIEIRKHSILLSKKHLHNYDNPDGLIFTDSNGEAYKPSYYVSKFRQLSRSVGFNVTPKNLAEFVYTERAVDALKESECKEVKVTAKGKEYHYVKTTVKTKNYTKNILAKSIDELREKYQACKNPYAFNTKKNTAKFSVFCHEELTSMNHLRSDEKSKITKLLEKYIYDLCENFTVNQIDDYFRARVMDSLKVQNCKLSTREHLTGFLRNVCDAAVKKNFIRYNPFVNVFLEADPLIKYHSLNENEISKILKLDSNDINNAFLQVKLLTGTRTAEALGLRWKDIINDKQIFIHSQLRAKKIVNTTKNYKPRRITPPPLAFEILDKIRDKTFRNKNNNLKLIFCNDDGTPLKPESLHEKLRNTIGRNNARLHDLRVTAITVLYKTTNNLELAAREAGHSNTDVTVKHYVDVVPDLNEAKRVQDNYYEGLKNDNS